MSQKVTRVLTGLAGLPVCKEPHKELLKYFDRVLRNLEKLPKDSKYRIMTEQTFKERTQIVQNTPDPREIERKIGDGFCEEMIEQAKLELKLIETMKEHKPWEPLTEKPSANQWKWPI